VQHQITHLIKVLSFSHDTDPESFAPLIYRLSTTVCSKLAQTSTNCCFSSAKKCGFLVHALLHAVPNLKIWTHRYRMLGGHKSCDRKPRVFTLRASCGAVYCNRSCLWVCLCVCGWVCYHDNSQLRALILTKLGLKVKVVTISTHSHTHSVLMAIFPGEPGWAGCPLNSPSPFIPGLCIL